MNSRPPLKPVATTLAVLGLALGAHAAGSLDHGDAKFLQAVAADNLAEIDLGKLAQQKAMRAEVKEFAGAWWITTPRRWTR